MSLPNDQRTVQDSDGNEIPFADIEVRDLAGGLVTIYSDSDGTTEITQPGFQSDANGFYRFYAQPGYYEITVTGPEGARVLPRVNLERGVTSLPDITSIADLNPAALVDGQQFYRGEFWPDTGVGGVDLYWDPNEPVANHNGGTIIDPARISQLDTGTNSFNNYFTANVVSGNLGCFIAVIDEPVIPTSLFGILSGHDVNIAARFAQDYLVSRFGGGTVVFDADGHIFTRDDLFVDNLFADFAIDVKSNMRFTATDNCEVRADKSVGGLTGGYCIFHIANNKHNIKIHGFSNINGIDKTTTKGIGQVVAIRGSEANPCSNIEIYDIKCKQIRDEPFRLGQTPNDDQFLASFVNIHNIEIDGCTSHGVVFRSLRDSSASGLLVKSAGRLGIDISSNNFNCHLHGGYGRNVFLGTRGGFKIEGNSGAFPSSYCSGSDVYYDGAAEEGNGSTDANGYVFRMTGDHCAAFKIHGKNAGGTGISFFQLAPGRTLDIEDVLIEDVLDVGDGTFVGSAYTLRDNTASGRGNRNVTFRDVEFRRCAGTTPHYLGGAKGNIKLVDSQAIVIDGSFDGVVQDTDLTLDLDNTVFEEINGGVSNTRLSVTRAVNLAAGKTAVRVIDSDDFTLTNCEGVNMLGLFAAFQDIPGITKVSNISGKADRMIRFVGATAGTVLVNDIAGDCTTSLVSQQNTHTVTKGLIVNTVAANAGNDIAGAGFTTANTL